MTKYCSKIRNRMSAMLMVSSLCLCCFTKADTVPKYEYTDKDIESIQNTSDRLSLKHCVMLIQSMEQIASTVKAQLPKEEHKNIENIVKAFREKLTTNNQALLAKIDKDISAQKDKESNDGLADFNKYAEYRFVMWMLIGRPRLGGHG